MVPLVHTGYQDIGRAAAAAPGALSGRAAGGCGCGSAGGGSAIGCSCCCSCDARGQGLLPLDVAVAAAADGAGLAGSRDLAHDLADGAGLAVAAVASVQSALITMSDITMSTMRDVTMSTMSGVAMAHDGVHLFDHVMHLVQGLPPDLWRRRWVSTRALDTRGNLWPRALDSTRPLLGGRGLLNKRLLLGPGPSCASSTLRT